MLVAAVGDGPLAKRLGVRIWWNAVNTGQVGHCTWNGWQFWSDTGMPGRGTATRDVNLRGVVLRRMRKMKQC